LTLEDNGFKIMAVSIPVQESMATLPHPPLSENTAMNLMGVPIPSPENWLAYVLPAWWARDRSERDRDEIGLGTYWNS
jgi:hypothetical protein